MSYRLPVMALLLMTAVISSMAAQDRSAMHGVAYMIAEETGSDATLKNIVADSIALQLKRRRAAIEALGGAGVSSLSRLLSAAAARNAQYLLLASYKTTTNEITLALHLYDVAGSREVGRSSVSGRIDLSLDTVVAQAIEEAVRGIEFRQPPAPQPAAQTATQTTQTPAAQPAGQSVAQAAPVPAAQSATQTAVLPAAQTATQTTQTPATQPADQSVAQAAPVPAELPAAQPNTRPRGKRATFGISSGAAPFLPMGPAGPYVTIGGLATLSLDLRFPVGPGTLSAGILSGTATMSATGAVTEADIILVPIGVDVLYTLNDGGFPAIALHLSGGPSLMNVTAPYAGSLTKVIPYLLAGMILELPFASWIGLSIEAQWAAFFESIDFPVMGFVPEVSLYVRI